MKNRHLFLFITAVSLLLGNSLTVHAESLKFVTAPTHSKQKTKEIYTPIVNFLKQTTGKNIELQLTINFLDYANKMRNGKFDITFDGPHFNSWRMRHLGDTPIVRLPGEIKIAIATKDEYTKFNTLDSLVGQRVCAFASPNLLTMAYLNHYTNPIRLPVLVPAKGFKGLVNCLQSGKGKAVVLRDKMWNKIDKSNLRLIALPDTAYPDRTFSTSKRVDATTSGLIKNALLSKEAEPHLALLLKTFKKPNLIAANPEEYKDIDKLLDQIWSFKVRR